MPVIMEFSTLCDPGKSVPADASPLVPPVFDQLGPHPRAAPREIPDLLERLAQVPDPRDPRGVRHPLVTVLALTACAVLAGARSLLAVSEWVADAPKELLERLGTRVDPLFPERSCVRNQRSAGCWRESTQTAWTARSAPGSRTGRAEATGCGGADRRREITAGCGPSRRTEDPPPGRLRSRRRPGPRADRRR
ncbi:transposase family protein [Streptomyces sp. NPDC093509]|uniref:transposase family protein n=1 Tax=Streptomyces sp. NPDC093509 TaxID=3154982 RepID=UPI00344DA901